VYRAIATPARPCVSHEASSRHTASSGLQPGRFSAMSLYVFLVAREAVWDVVGWDMRWDRWVMEIGFGSIC
jgi:hypothetical protein